MDNLSLCSGGAGLDLGLELCIGTLRTVCWVEWEAFACEFLASRMEEKCLAEAPIWSDLRTFDGAAWRGCVDSLTAGYPCQPFSNAGKRRGENDPRHLWPEVRRIISECGPSLLFLENVGAHLGNGADTVFRELQDLGYEVAAGLFTAEEIGAPHRRERLFILGYSEHAEGRCHVEVGGSQGGVVVGRSVPAMADTHGSERRTRGTEDANGPEGTNRTLACHWQVADSSVEGWKGYAGRELQPSVVASGLGTLGNADDAGSQGWGVPGSECASKRTAWRPSSLFPAGPNGNWNAVPQYLWPAIEPNVCGLVDGLASNRANWLRLLGNGVVPLEAAYAFCTLWSSLMGNR